MSDEAAKRLFERALMLKSQRDIRDGDGDGMIFDGTPQERSVYGIEEKRRTINGKPFRFEPGGPRQKRIAEIAKLGIEQLEAAGVLLPDMIQVAPMSNLAVAWSDTNDYSIGSRVTLNSKSKTWKDPDYSAKAFKSGYHSTDNPAHSVVHEAGHLLHKKTMNADRESGMRNHQFHGDMKAKVQAEVGKYATTNGLEFVAEVFAAKVYYGRKFSDEIELLYMRFDGPVVPAK